MPVILKLVPRRNKTWAELVLSAGESLRLPIERVPSWAAAGAPLSEPQLRELRKQSAYYLAYDRAVRLLSVREHFSEELKRKLSQREQNGSIVAQVLARLQEQGFLDDARAAGLICAQLIERGGLGKLRIRQELYRRGCPRELSEQALAEHGGKLDDSEEMRALLAKRRKTFGSRLVSQARKLAAQELSRPKLIQQLRFKLGTAVLAYLAGRGFSGDEARSQARELVESLLTEQDWIS